MNNKKGFSLKKREAFFLSFWERLNFNAFESGYAGFREFFLTFCKFLVEGVESLHTIFKYVVVSYIGDHECKQCGKENKHREFPVKEEYNEY